MCNNKVPVKLISATSQSWAAGTQRGGTGIDYSITVESTTDKPVSFSTLYVNGFILEVLAKPKEKDVTKNDKGVAYHVISQERSAKTYAKASLPIASEAKAVLALKSDGVTYYLEIPNFKKLPHNPMP